MDLAVNCLQQSCSTHPDPNAWWQGTVIILVIFAVILLLGERYTRNLHHARQTVAQWRQPSPGPQELDPEPPSAAGKRPW